MLSGAAVARLLEHRPPDRDRSVDLGARLLEHRPPDRDRSVAVGARLLEHRLPDRDRSVDRRRECRKDAARNAG